MGLILLLRGVRGCLHHVCIAVACTRAGAPQPALQAPERQPARFKVALSRGKGWTLTKAATTALGAEARPGVAGAAFPSIPCPCGGGCWGRHRGGAAPSSPWGRRGP